MDSDNTIKSKGELMKRLCFISIVILGLNFCSAQDTIFGSHTVSKGETIDNIAKRYNTTSQSILQLNNITDPRKIQIGQQLKIIVEIKPSGAENAVGESKSPTEQSSFNNLAVVGKESKNVKLSVDTSLRLDPGSDNSYAWKSSHPKIVSVDDNGVITTHAKGSATITAKSKQRRQNCRWTITVEDGSESADGDAEPTGLPLKKFILSIVIIAFVVIIVARKWNNIVGLFSKQRMNLQSDIAVNNGLLEQISKLEGEKNRLLNENNRLQRENVVLEREITALKSQLDEILEDNIRTGKELDDLKAGANNKSLNANNKENAPSRSQTQSQNPTVLYADAIVDGKLIRVKEVAGDDSIFELHLSNPHTANFVICKDAVQRVIANPSFIDGCEKQILPNASKVEIVTPGTAQKEVDSGKWLVVEKLKVNIK